MKWIFVFLVSVSLAAQDVEEPKVDKALIKDSKTAYEYFQKCLLLGEENRGLFKAYEVMSANTKQALKYEELYLAMKKFPGYLLRDFLQSAHAHVLDETAQECKVLIVNTSFDIVEEIKYVKLIKIWTIEVRREQLEKIIDRIRMVRKHFMRMEGEEIDVTPPGKRFFMKSCKYCKGIK